MIHKESKMFIFDKPVSLALAFHVLAWVSGHVFLVKIHKTLNIFIIWIYFLFWSPLDSIDSLELRIVEPSLIIFLTRVILYRQLFHLWETLNFPEYW